MADDTLIADPQRPRDASERTVVEVAVAVLLGADGSFLLTSRPNGKSYEGYWEFPGGKLEPGEDALDALRRELMEEIGVRVVSAQFWYAQLVDYPHALVRLNFFKVLAWSGTLQMREAQACRWQQLPVQVAPVLPGAVPVLERLALERNHSGRTH